MKIAVLTSTRPLRERTINVGREVETFSPKKCSDLAAQYDLIILGSRASDDFYDRIRASLPRKVLDKFRLYPRSFFDRFKRRGAIPNEYDDRDEGWKEILSANGINYVTSARTATESFRDAGEVFRWSRLDRFIRDDRVTVIK
jgi:hypothetical protein